MNEREPDSDFEEFQKIAEEFRLLLEKSQSTDNTHRTKMIGAYAEMFKADVCNLLAKHQYYLGYVQAADNIISPSEVKAEHERIKSIIATMREGTYLKSMLEIIFSHDIGTLVPMDTLQFAVTTLKINRQRDPTYASTLIGGVKKFLSGTLFELRSCRGNSSYDNRTILAGVKLTLKSQEKKNI